MERRPASPSCRPSSTERDLPAASGRTRPPLPRRGPRRGDHSPPPRVEALFVAPGTAVLAAAADAQLLDDFKAQPPARSDEAGDGSHEGFPARVAGLRFLGVPAPQVAGGATLFSPLFDAGSCIATATQPAGRRGGRPGTWLLQPQQGHTAGVKEQLQGIAPCRASCSAAPLGRRRAVACWCRPGCPRAWMPELLVLARPPVDALSARRWVNLVAVSWQDLAWNKISGRFLDFVNCFGQQYPEQIGS